MMDGIKTKLRTLFAGAQHGSSILLGPAGMVLWIVLGLFALHMKAALPAGIFLALLLFGIVSNGWAVVASRRVQIDLSCRKPWVYPGQEVKLTYTVKNKKKLPLFWLEVNQNGQETEAFVPDDCYEAYHEAGTVNEESYLRQNFAWIGPMSTMQADCIWTAKQRGIYRMTHLSARTGDGFGLAVRAVLLPRKKLPVLAVYPAYIPVNTSPFLMQYWENASGQKGWMEDHTVLKGSRMYQPGDPWKQINWRMAAREQGIQVNLYESIQPGRVHLILDGESFAEDADTLELTLQVIGSLLTELACRQLKLQLTLSKSKSEPAVTLDCREGDESLRSVLFALAAYTCRRERKQVNGPITPSVFPEYIRKDGSIWLFTMSGKELPQALLEQLEGTRLRIVAATDIEEARMAGVPVMHLNQFTI